MKRCFNAAYGSNGFSSEAGAAPFAGAGFFSFGSAAPRQLSPNPTTAVLVSLILPSRSVLAGRLHRRGGRAWDFGPKSARLTLAPSGRCLVKPRAVQIR